MSIFPPLFTYVLILFGAAITSTSSVQIYYQDRGIAKTLHGTYIFFWVSGINFPYFRAGFKTTGIIQQQPSSSYIPSLNLLRGLAALSVCCFHILFGDFMDVYPWIKAIAAKGHLGLDLFFVISGFVIPYAMYQNRYSFSQFPRFLLKRSIRIEIPYIASFSIYLLFLYIEARFTGYIFTFEYARYFLHFFYLQEYAGYITYSPVYWTLAIEFQFYLLAGCFFPLMIHKNRGIQLSFFLLFGFLSWFLVLHNNWFIFQFGFLFLSGIVIFLYQVKNIPLKVFLPTIALVLCMVYFKNGPQPMYMVLLAATGILYLKKEWSITRFLGNISFSLYLTHISSAGLFRKYLRSTITDDLLLRLISIGFAILYATLFYYAIEKPAFRLSKKIRYKKKEN